jgi:hypothetical protein
MMNTPNAKALPQDDLQFSALFQKGPGDYCPDINEDATLEALSGKDIIVVTNGANLSSGRGGLTDTAGGPAYIAEILVPSLRAAGASVIEHVVPVDDLVKGVEECDTDSIKNAQKLLVIEKYIRDKICEWAKEGKLVIQLDGCHSFLAAAAGILMAHPDPDDPEYSTLKLIMNDGDADARRDPKDEEAIHGDKKLNAHGRTTSLLQGKGPDDLAELMEGVPLLREEHTLYIGAQRIDKPEVGYLKESGSPYLGLDALHDHSELVDAFLEEFVDGDPYMWVFDPDLLPKAELKQNPDPSIPAGAPMAGVEGLQTQLFLRYCRTLGGSNGQVVYIEAAEIAAACDKLNAGLTRDAVIGGIFRVLTGGDEDYRVGYDAFAQ